jgi:putative spermidine/putrescine transport system substrate-binding protein
VVASGALLAAGCSSSSSSSSGGGSSASSADASTATSAAAFGGMSQDEFNAVQHLKGQSRAPDVLDVGTAFAVKGNTGGLLAPYKVASWANIPASSKAADATYYADYGGYVAIGYNSAKVKTPPTSLKDLLKPIYKNEVAINRNPTQAGAAFAAVYAAAIANGGSFSNIAPGIAYFKKLYQEGNFVPVTASAGTMESGQTPILI